MKNLVKRIAVISMAFLMMVTYMPCAALTAEASTAGVEPVYSIPESLTLDKYETKTITVNVEPADTGRIYHLSSMGHMYDDYETNYIDSGTYFGKEAKVSITGKTAGSTPLTLEIEEFDNAENKNKLRTIKLVCDITVTDNFTEGYVGLEGILLNKSSITLENGSYEQLPATNDPEDAWNTSTITWASSNNEVASVNANGKVHGYQYKELFPDRPSDAANTKNCRILPP